MDGVGKDHIVDCVDDGIIVVDTDMIVRTFNQAAELITGLSKQGALDRPLHHALRDNPHLISQITRTIESGQTSFNHEAALRTRDGKERYISLTCSPVTDETGRTLGVAAVFKDRTFVREMEERARQSDGLALLGTMAAGIAHEVKNPLGGIRGAAQILRKGVLEGGGDKDTLLQCADLVIQQVDRIDRLIEELLDLSAPKKLKVVPVNINKLLSDLVRLIRTSNDHDDLRFELAFDPSLPPVKGDEERLTQIFLNIIRNAVEAIKERPGPGAIRVLSRIDFDPHPSRPAHSSQPMIAVEISDNGPGIKAEDLNKLFTPFFTTKEHGSGLGLALSHKLVENHGGTLKLTSTYGKGTTVRLILPAAETS